MNVEEMMAKVYDLEGDYAECGVWQGFMADHIYKGMNHQANLWLLDTFRGHRQPSEFDDAKFHPQGRYRDTSEVAIMQRFPKAKVVVGPVEDTLSLLEKFSFRFVHIDLDHYLPTKAACEFFKSRMVPRGIIRFDDYLHGETPGATKAINEVFGEENILTADYRWEHTSREVSTCKMT